MRRVLRLTLLAIFVVSALSGLVIGYGAAGRITDILVDQEVRSAHAALEDRFQKFDLLIGAEERDMEVRMTKALAVMARDLIGPDLAYRTLSSDDLARWSETHNVSNSYIIDKNTVIVATDFEADLNFELGSISPDFRAFMNSLYGKGMYHMDRINMSSKTGILTKYGYYSPPGSDYIAEVSINVRDYMSRMRSPEFTKFIFEQYFKDIAQERDYLTTIDIHMTNAVGRFSLFDRNSNLPASVVTALTDTDRVVQADGPQMTVYSRVDPVASRLDTASFLAITTVFDFSQLHDQVERVTLLLVSMMIGASLVAYVIAERLASRYVVDRVEKVRRGVAAIAEGGYGHALNVRGEDEITDIVRDINIMRERIQADLQHRMETEKRLTMLADQQMALRKEAQSSERATNQFLATVSHEIRTPMTAVMAMSYQLMDTDLSPEQSRNVRSIKSAGDALLSLINDILDQSKLEAGQLRIDDQGYSLDGVVQDVVDSLSYQAGQKDLRLLYEVDPALKHGVCGDPLRVRQILLNLVGNAVKFTQQGEVRLGVQLEIPDSDHPMICFAVTDTGVGIAEADQDQLFARFHQADNSTSRQFGGSGLGLSIAKQLVEVMAGEIGFDSSFGQGSRFWFRLPYRKSSAKVPFQLTSARTDVKALRPLKLLLAEDNKTNQLLIGTLIKKIGHDFEVVENGEQAVLAVRDGDFDGVVMDIRMPVMDGMEATRQIRQLAAAEKQTIPIVALTADAMPENVAEYKAAGMDEVAFKPFNPIDFAAKLDRAFGEAVHEVTRRPMAVTPPHS